MSKDNPSKRAHFFSTKELHDKPVVATMIWYRVGSRNEELGQTGKSHFSTYAFQGTDRYKKRDRLITLLNGGANNAFTWLDFTVIISPSLRTAGRRRLKSKRPHARTLFDEENSTRRSKS